ncbi:hypothetical protein EDB92DRAFT_1814151 [Lactarius akahatsu]|uniref:Uncharacterized protein n=1 Tax=Lactarius akahatsu TaxID=416441 RepID=A0AAD4LQU6_9AGAM|nr:hypothetical protein EDB92DRAFT_1814151 [Lactarius akahatsu]
MGNPSRGKRGAWHTGDPRSGTQCPRTDRAVKRGIIEWTGVERRVIGVADGLRVAPQEKEDGYGHVGQLEWRLVAIRNQPKSEQARLVVLTLKRGVDWRIAGQWDKLVTPEKGLGCTHDTTSNTASDVGVKHLSQWIVFYVDRRECKSTCLPRHTVHTTTHGGHVPVHLLANPNSVNTLTPMNTFGRLCHHPTNPTTNTQHRIEAAYRSKLSPRCHPTMLQLHTEAFPAYTQ